MREVSLILALLTIYNISREFWITYKDIKKGKYIFWKEIHNLQHIILTLWAIILIFIMVYFREWITLFIFSLYGNFILYEHLKEERLPNIDHK